MRRLLLTLALMTSCAPLPDDAAPVPVPVPVPVPALSLPPAPAPAPAPAHTPLDGHAFPDRVLSLTWDDGPDANTLALATYLARRNVSATFFVVGSWIDGLSDEPGRGNAVFESGYDYLPILGDLVALGHRVANHTLHHVVLREAAGTATVDRELRENQRHLDPFLTNELRLFRAPGGGWGAFAQGIVDGDPYLGRLVGPIAWDVDRKDWDESLHCRGPRGAFECERAAPGGALRMKPAVVAARYVAAIESAGRGIVLLHDRVGHVGSTYSLEIAQAMIPQLEARGFVFAAPVLRFSALTERHRDADASDAHHWEPSSVRVGDVNGDGRRDLCGRASVGVSCALSMQSTFNAGDRLPKTLFRAESAAPPAPAAHGAPAGTLHLADVTGDGHADVCIAGPEGIVCAAPFAGGEVGAFRAWSQDDRLSASSSHAFADIDGDGRADLCAHSATGIACARNGGRSFERARTWLAALAGAMHLADVDGDGRADVCTRGAGGGVECALSTGVAFGGMKPWSAPGDLGDGELLFGDLNGDRRADVCAHTREGFACALSTARGFTKGTLWLAGDLAEAQLGDVNGDGRADLCGRALGAFACALAP